MSSARRSKVAGRWPEGLTAPKRISASAVPPCSPAYQVSSQAGTRLNHAAESTLPPEVTTRTVLGFAADISRFAPPRPARRPVGRSRPEPQPAALRRSRRRIARVRSFSVRRLPTWPGATCKVLASRRDQVKSGRLISPDRTFRRRSPIGSRPCQRPRRRRSFARGTPLLEINWVNCFSFLCDSQTYISNVPVVTCHCPIGESLAGTPVPPRTAFLTQAGQGDEAYCAKYPVSGPLSIP